MVDHIRRFVHETGCIYVILRKLDNLIPGGQTNILMWSWCRKCKQVNLNISYNLIYVYLFDWTIAIKPDGSLKSALTQERKTNPCCVGLYLFSLRLYSYKYSTQNHPNSCLCLLWQQLFTKLKDGFRVKFMSVSQDRRM